MESISFKQAVDVAVDENELLANVELVKSTIGHLDRDMLNLVLMTALVENCHHHAKQSDDYKKASEEFGDEPTWGGGQIKAKCGVYYVDVSITHVLKTFSRETLLEKLNNGADPFELLAELQELTTGAGGPESLPEDCNCPVCKLNRKTH